MKAMTRKSGQGMTEYIIIVAIIAIGAILIIGLFGKQIKGVFAGMGASLGGKDDQNTAVASDVTGRLETESQADEENMTTFEDNEQN